MRPSELLKILSVPGTNERLTLVTTSYAGNEPYDGWLEDNEGRVWGRLEAFRFRFVNFPDVTPAERRRMKTDGPRAITVQESDYTSALSERFQWSGKTLELEGYLKGFDNGRSGEHVVVETSSPTVEIIFSAHGWSGIVRVEVNGRHEADIDLFNRECAIPRRYVFKNRTRSRISLKISPLAKNPHSQGEQLLLDGMVEYRDSFHVPQYSKIAARNRGGAFSGRFFDICGTLPSEAVILDVGGGRRQLSDERYINLDYSSFEEPDIIGDGTALPFCEGTIDFVYTAAVLEHVRDPLAMGRELHRVLKSRGKILANAAFTQPIHSEGQHFFNLTPYGIDITFERFTDRKIWWDVGFFDTMKWFAEVAQLSSYADPNKVDAFLELAKEFSPLIPNDRGMYLASGVWLEGVK